MAFREIQISDINDLITKLETFCKNTLNWHKAYNKEFQPHADGEKFQVFDIQTNQTIGNLYRNLSGFKTKIVGDSVHSGCNKLLAFERVWFKGDRDNVLVVIQTYPNVFRWFGFGEMRNYKHPITWNVGSYWFSDVTFLSYLNYPQNRHLTFFGLNGCNETIDYNSTIANRIKYKDEFYTDKRLTPHDYNNFFGGGANSFPFAKYIDLAEVKTSGQRLIAKTPLFIHKSPKGKRVIIGEMPLWYVCSLFNIKPLHEFNFGNKKYIVFPIGNPVEVNDFTNGNSYLTETNRYLALAPLSENSGFAVCMDD